MRRVLEWVLVLALLLCGCGKTAEKEKTAEPETVAGVDAKTLSTILGHTDASFTLDCYTHVTTDMQREAATLIGGIAEDILGKELKPWQDAKPGTEA